MPYLTAIDPGVSSGIVLGFYDEVQPWVRVDFWLVKDGLEGVLDWYYADAPIEVHGSQWLAEKFVLRAQDFVANCEPLRIEGALVALGLQPVWQLRTDKALCKDDVLREHGLWVTGKQCGHTDGRDINDAESHSLARMKKIRHIPSLRKYFS